MRLDMYIKEKLSLSRSKARELIENGCVSVNNKLITKPAFQIEEGDEAAVKDRDNVLKYVSRGGYKLEKALIQFDIVVDNAVCIDIGASTGGFTHCLLKNGARRVYAVDVGTSQLSPFLRNDERVVVMENTDARNLFPGVIPEADIITADVSFISLEKIMKNISALLKSDGAAVLLVKPQFEAGRENISSKGIVRNKRVHSRVIKKIADCAEENGLGFRALTYSPIKGGSGNIEYLLCVQKGGGGQMSLSAAEKAVELAADCFD